MLKYNLCDYNDVYILIRGGITVIMVIMIVMVITVIMVACSEDAK